MAMIPLPEAQSVVLEGTPVLDPHEVDFTAASGLVIADRVLGTELVPPLDNTAVDGYAVRSADVASVPVELTVVGEVAAGAATDHVLVEGETIRLMRGPPLPAG